MKKLFASALVRFLCIFLVTALVAAALATRLTHPFGGVLAVLAAGALACCLWIPRPWVTYVSITAMSFFATCAGVEMYFTAANDMNNTVFEGRYLSGPDPVLGYAPRAEAEPIASRRLLRGKELYNVTYTTRDDGWRVTPEHPDATQAVLFFGCSYTMGEGVSDRDSYPYMVGEMLGPHWQVYNFGFSGYGPHQFLAQLQSGRLDAIFHRYTRVHVFFMNIWGHELRSGGYSPWDTHGPRYVLEGGKAVRRGDFSQPLEPGLWGGLTHALARELKKTELCNKVLLRIVRWDETRLKNLQTAILAEAGAYIRERYTNADFTVLVYPTVAENAPQFRAAGLTALDMTPALPGWPNDALYRIPEDKHPTPLAQKLAAGAIAAFLRGETPAERTASGM